MNHFEDLLTALEEAKISLALDGDALVVTAAKGALTDDLKVALREHKSTIIESLRNGRRLSSAFEVVVPANKITPDSTVLTPDMLPLIDLTQSDIDQILAKVPGGLANIQDIYSLAPLQEGILFHHLLASEGDPYLQTGKMAFSSRKLLDEYLAAVQKVIDRHDILRTAFYWEGLSTQAQVVMRKAALSVTEVKLDPKDGPIQEQLAKRFDPRHHRIDLSQPPLLRAFIAYDEANDCWEMFRLLHHLIDDISTVLILSAEIHTFLAGLGHTLAEPQPFRRLIAQVRLGKSPQEHERFFQKMLADIDEPTSPFGQMNVLADNTEITELVRKLPQALNNRLRVQARRLGVSVGSLCHLAWGQVVARTSGKDNVVFGTILFGRMHAGEGADQIMGPFINTLPIRLDLDETGVEESVRITHTRLAELLSHEHASLSLAQRCSGIAAPMPLFTSLLNYRHNRESESESLAVVMPEADRWDGFEERTNYPITLSVDDYGDALGLSVQVVEGLSGERLFAYMQQTLESMAHALEVAPHMPVRQLDVLPASERNLLLKTWNDTDTPYPAELCIHQLFEQQVERTPDAVALRFEEQSLSYAELNAEANRLAHHLIEQGVRPDDRVAICVDRSVAMVVGLMAIIKAGGAYVPLDPAYPAERLTYILRDAAPSLLLLDATGRAATNGLALGDVKTLDLSSATPAWASAPAANPDAQALGLTSRHLAYVIYTSGSTGNPKGAQNEHHALINRLLWMQQAYALDHRDAVLQKTTFSFDVSVWEFFWPLATGATLVMATPDAHKDTQTLIALIRRYGISTMHFVPSMLNLFLGNEEVSSCSSLRQLMCSGEALAASSVRRCRQVLPNVQVHNLYGPTEAAIDVTAWTAPDELSASASVSIGRPISNLRIYLLDPHGQPVPLGVSGELYIGGVGVARGYLNRPELTKERFLADPFAGTPDARMYRTGDLARYLPDGNIEYLGRNDHQIKLRGFRIELGEIEAHLTRQPSIREAVVVAGQDATGETRLVAYVVPDAAILTEDSSPAGLIAVWRADLAIHLPEYMVPAAFVTLDALPLTPNGKLDRKALPEPDDSAFARRAYEAPQGEIETIMAGLWQELLGVERIGRHDHFFELGGHSLLAVQLMERLRRLDLSTEIRALFESPTLAELASKTIELTETRI